MLRDRLSEHCAVTTQPTICLVSDCVAQTFTATVISCDEVRRLAATYTKQLDAMAMAVHAITRLQALARGHRQKNKYAVRKKTAVVIANHVAKAIRGQNLAFRLMVQHQTELHSSPDNPEPDNLVRARSWLKLGRTYMARWRDSLVSEGYCNRKYIEVRIKSTLCLLESLYTSHKRG